tara:strand:+ start:128053 stop:128262 length:210 start_codon:yes stop_codon:yes gene_type:complete
MSADKQASCGSMSADKQTSCGSMSADKQASCGSMSEDKCFWPFIVSANSAWQTRQFAEGLPKDEYDERD